jgi:hypothetical protein
MFWLISCKLISFELGEKMVLDTRCTPVVTEFSSTVTEITFFVDRPIWWGFVAELYIQKYFPLSTA